MHEAICAEEARRTPRYYPRVRARSRTYSVRIKENLLEFIRNSEIFNNFQTIRLEDLFEKSDMKMETWEFRENFIKICAKFDENSVFLKDVAEKCENV